MRFETVRRREFMTLLGGAAAACPLAARAQQAAMPVIGYLDPRSPDAISERLRAFRQGLKDAGFVEGENVAIEYRWAEGQYERLQALAADLVRRQVAVITPAGTPSIFAAKAATSTIPIVFMTGDDPVRVGLVASLARPGGNLTGIGFLTTELAAKRLELLRELSPNAARVAILVNPASAAQTEATVREVEPAARTMGLQIQVFNANTSREIGAAFESMERERPDALFVGPDPFFTARRVQLAHLATRYAGHDRTPVAPQNAAFPTYKAPRVHHAARRRGGRVAARGAGAAGGEAPDHRGSKRANAFYYGPIACGLPVATRTSLRILNRE